MKKFIVIVASLLIAVSAHAQFGVVAGITSSSSNLKDAVADVQTQNITQYHVGITYKLDLGLIAIQPSILYNMKGTKLNVANIGATDDIEYKTGYIEVPVQLQAGLNLGVARIYGFAEPFVGYAITNQVNSSLAKDPQSTWNNIKSKSGVRCRPGCRRRADQACPGLCQVLLEHGLHVWHEHRLRRCQVHDC